MEQHRKTASTQLYQVVNFPLKKYLVTYPAAHIKYLSQYSSCGKKWIPSSGQSKPSTSQCRLVLFSQRLVIALNSWPFGHRLGIGWPITQMKNWSQPAKLGSAVLFSTFRQMLLLHVWLQKLLRVILSLPFTDTVASATANDTMATISDSENYVHIFWMSWSLVIRNLQSFRVLTQKYFITSCKTTVRRKTKKKRRRRNRLSFTSGNTCNSRHQRHLGNTEAFYFILSKIRATLEASVDSYLEWYCKSFHHTTLS